MGWLTQDQEGKKMLNFLVAIVDALLLFLACAFLVCCGVDAWLAFSGEIKEFLLSAHLLILKIFLG
jgi:hypothetical protein